MLNLKLLKERYGVAQLSKEERIPDWALESNFYSITKTEDELSILCEERLIPKEVKSEKNFRAFKIEGPLDFSLIGILSKISTILAEEKISIFAVSTYDTDYILVKGDKADKAVSALRAKEYIVRE